MRQVSYQVARQAAVLVVMVTAVFASLASVALAQQTTERPGVGAIEGRVTDGYNQMLKSYQQNNDSVTAGRRMHGGTIGVIASISASETTRGTQDVEVVYTPALGLNELNPRYYQGVSDRPLQEEHYQGWMNFGVKVGF
jgi:hypothetical protein